MANVLDLELLSGMMLIDVQQRSRGTYVNYSRHFEVYGVVFNFFQCESGDTAKDVRLLVCER